MLCFVLLCFVLLCFVVLCYVMLCHVHVMLCYIMLSYITLVYVTIHYITLCDVILYCTLNLYLKNLAYKFINIHIKYLCDARKTMVTTGRGLRIGPWVLLGVIQNILCFIGVLLLLFFNRFYLFYFYFCFF